MNALKVIDKAIEQLQRLRNSAEIELDTEWTRELMNNNCGSCQYGGLGNGCDLEYDCRSVPINTGYKRQTSE